MRIKTNWIVLFIFTSFYVISWGQNEQKEVFMPRKHVIAIKTQFSHFEEGVNQGLDFAAGALVLSYRFSKFTPGRKLTVNSQASFGSGFENDRTLAFSLSPTNLFYGFKLKNSETYIGGYGALNYQWQQYSNGFFDRVVWLSNLSFGPKINTVFSIGDKQFSVDFSTSIAAATSRPTSNAETNIPEPQIRDFVVNAHENLRFNFINTFNYTQFEIGAYTPREKRFFLSYTFEYFGYYADPKMAVFHNSISFNWKLNRIHKS